jgi:sugar lactone lactonase YvrE
MTRILFGFAFVTVWLAPQATAQPVLYVVNSGDTTVKQVPPGGGSFTNYATAFNFPVGLATASNGTLYVSDQNANTVLKIAAGGGTPTTYASGFNGPNAIALDASGNLYVADMGADRILKVAPGGLSATVLATASNFSPFGLALNAAGTTLYVSDLQAQEVYSVPTATPSTPYTPTPLAVVSRASGLAVGSDGTVYVGSYDTNTIRAIPPGGGTPTTYASGFMTPYGLALDATGNLFVSNFGGGSIYKVPPGGGTSSVYVSGLDGPYFIAFAPVPEPGAVLFACGAVSACFAGWRRIRQRSRN